MPNKRQALVTCCGLVIAGAFFLPWLRTGRLAGPSGWMLARDGLWFAGAGSTRALWLVPACGLVIASGVFGRFSRAVTACAGVVAASILAFVVVRPLVPFEGGLFVALVGSATVLAGDLMQWRSSRAVGALAIGGSFLLDWFGRTGLETTHPASCPNIPVTMIPWGVVIAGGIAMASAIAPHRAARVLARLGCAIAVVTVLAYVVVAYDLIATALWSSIAASVLAVLVALV